MATCYFHWGLWVNVNSAVDSLTCCSHCRSSRTYQSWNRWAYSWELSGSWGPMPLLLSQCGYYGSKNGNNTWWSLVVMCICCLLLQMQPLFHTSAQKPEIIRLFVCGGDSWLISTFMLYFHNKCPSTHFFFFIEVVINVSPQFLALKRNI